GAGQLPLEPLRSLDVRGGVGLDSLQLLNMKVTELRAEVDGRGGQFRVHPITMKLYDGGYSGDMRFDVRGERPKFAVNEELKGVQVGPLLADLIGKDHVTGTGFVTADLAGTGIEPEVVRRTLSGEAAFRFTEGAVKGINIAQMLRKAQAALGGGSAPEDATKKTDFTELKGSVRIDKGVVRNDDLSAKSPLLRVDGAGQANIVKETVDYRVKTSVVGSLQGQGGKDLGELKGLTVPIRVTGTFSKPEFDVELDSVLKDKAKQAVEEKKQQLKEEAERKLKEKVQDEAGDKAEDAAKDKLKDKLEGLFR
ncbi:MAG TPA: AsmA-like C-terminal region-containing protein, partial [Gammaproteobacteria bacterium]|nr:AsmA-like C-terminal region-containing protein [Gammaproteobacteria bacterium]